MNLPRRLLVPLGLFGVWEMGAAGVSAQWFSGPGFWLAAFLLTVLGLTVLMVYFSLSRLAMRQTAAAGGPGVEVPASASPVSAAPLAGAGAATAVEVAPIVELIREAESRLAQSHLKTALADLPLYLLAGPAGAGKTSTFLATGLSPELLAGQVNRESTVLPTAWCNLWYASHAIFAEAGGRFVTEDAGAWRELVKRLVGGSSLLGKRGPGLRGLIWFCDITPFLGMPDPTRIDGMARRMQERLQAVAETVGSSFPVYVVFTKADQIPHFRDFVQRLTDDEDQQVFGCTLPSTNLPGAGEVYADAQTSRLLDPFNRLYAAMAERRMPLLARESDGARKPGVYEFPREMKRLRDSLIHFLVDGFRPNPLQPSPLLRGFYFTGTREVPAASALESHVAEVAKTAGGEATVLFDGSLVPPASASAEAARPAGTMVTRWMFHTRLFHQVVLADPLSRAAAEKNVHRETRQRAVYGLAAAACLVLTAGLSVSWWNNRALLRDLEAAVARETSHAAPGALATAAELGALEELRRELVRLRAHDQYGAPMSLRWGLYAGSKVLAGAYQAYFGRFEQYFYHGSRSALAAQLARLEAPAAVPYGAAYDTLKAYRMITSGTCRPEAAFLVPVFTQSWLAGRPLEEGRLALAEKQIRFYAQELQRKNPYRAEEKPEVVERGRAYLAGFGGVDRLYRGILEEANRPPRQAARLAELAPNFRDVLASPGEVAAAFTRDGSLQVEKAIREPGRQSLGEACVVGGATAFAAGPEVVAQLTSRYQRAQTEAWKEFVKQSAVLPFRSAGQAARHLEILADNRSPLLAVLFLVSENTNAGAGAKVFQPSREVSPAASRERLIEEPNRAYMNALGEMQRAMARLEGDRPGNPDVALHEQARRAAENGLDAVRMMAQRFNINEAEGMDGEVKRLLESPFRHSLRLVITDPGKIGRDKAAGAARGFCAKLSAVSQKFPFNSQSDVDVTAEEMAALFAPPQGALFALQQQLGRSVTRQGRYWVATPDADPRPAPEFVEFLNQMTAISEALFADGQMRMRYTLRALPAPGVELITLDIDGERATAKAGANVAKGFTWPGPAGSQQALVRVKAGANIPFASYDGPWAVFRLMADADPRPPGSRVVELSKVRRGKGRAEAVLDSSDRPIQVRLELSDLPGNGVFDRGFFRGRCPVKVAE